MNQIGTITLSEPITGDLRVAYTRREDFVSPESELDLLPYRRSVDPDTTVVAIDSLVQAAQLFRKLADLTSEPQWIRAAEAASATLRNLQIDQPVSLFRRLPGLDALADEGIRIISTHPSLFTTAYRLPTGVLSVYLPPESNASVAIHQVTVNTTITPDSEFSVEVGASTEAIASLVLLAGSQEWIADIAVNPTVRAQRIVGRDFVRWGNETEWHPRRDTVAPVSQGAATTTIQYQNATSRDQNPLVMTFTLTPNLGVAGVWLDGSFGVTPSRIHYSADTAVRLQLIDGDGFAWEAPLSPTGDKLVERSLNWSDFLLSPTQQNPGRLPSAPRQDQPIRRYGIFVATATAMVSVQYIGEPPELFTEPLQSTGWQMRPVATIAHALMIGDVVIQSITPPPYGVLPTELIVRPESKRFRGNSLLWRQNPGDPETHRLWRDSQDAYLEQTGVDGPFRLSYRWAINGSPGFTDQDAVADLSSGIYQALVGAIAAQQWHESGAELLETVVTRWVNFLDAQWGEDSATILSTFAPLPVAGNTLMNSAIAALYCRAALFCNIAGGDRLTSFRVLRKSVALLLENLDYQPEVSIQQGGEGAVEIMQTIAALLIHQKNIRLPLPSEQGNTDPNFATQVLQVQQFSTALNLTRLGAYGFRFRVPVEIAADPTDLAVTFTGASSFTANLEVINSADLAVTFTGASSFTANLEVINSADLAVTFTGASGFTADLEVVNPTNLAVTFTGASNFTGDLEVVNPTDLAVTFTGTSSFTADLEVSVGPPIPTRHWTSEQGISFDGNWKVHQWRDTITNALLSSNNAMPWVPELVDGGIGFDGVDDFMVSSTANLQVGTIIIVYRQRANSSNGGLISCRATGGGKAGVSSETIHLGTINSSSDFIHAIGGTNLLNVNNNTNLSVNDFTDNSVGIDPGNLNSIQVVGFTRPNSNTGSKTFVVGADVAGAIGTNHINAIIYEILIYPTQLSAADLNSKVSELVDKYSPTTRDGDFAQFISAHSALDSTLSTTEQNVIAGAISTLKNQNRWSLLDEIYVMVGSNKDAQMHLRLKPVITADSGMPVENVNNPNPIEAFTSQGIEFSTDNRFIRSNNLMELGASNSFSFGVYVNRASGVDDFGTYAVLGFISSWQAGNSGIIIGTSPSSDQNLGLHGAYNNVTFSNQSLSHQATGFFSFSGTQNGLRRPYINGSRATEGPNGFWFGTALPLGFTGSGNTRIAGGFASRSILSDEDHAALYGVFQALNAALGRAVATPPPFRIQAEDFVAAFDSTPGDNQGGQYRAVGPNNPGVDIGNTGIDGSFNIGWTTSGEWLEYNVNIPVTGTYNIRIPTSMNGSGTQMRVLIDGSEIALINVPNTGSWLVWVNNIIYNVSLTAGTRLLRIEFAVGGFDLDFFEFIGVST